MPQEFCCYYSDVSKLHMICHSRLASTAHVGVIHQRLTSDWSTAIFFGGVCLINASIYPLCFYLEPEVYYIYYIYIYISTDNNHG